MRSILIGTSWVLLTCLVPRGLAAEPERQASVQRRPNILFIAVDDLRPQLGCYGKTGMHSPHLDALAASGVLFERAYCMVPTCGASRASLMTGLRPSRNRFVNYLARADKDAPDATTLNSHFRQAGYRTVSLGKVFHHTADNRAGWSEPPWRPQGGGYQLPENRKLQARTNASGKRLRGPPYEAAEAEDTAYADGMIADQAIAKLQRLAKQDSPFFLAVGFLKPHLPFVAPQKYWDLYDADQIRLPANYRAPENAPEVALHNSGELRSYHGVPSRGPVSDQMARRMIHGYYACVSFVDAQIGRVLDRLRQLDLDDNTIVVVWGDHGWNLGDHQMWCKHSCFESSLHAPLIVRAPGIAGGQTRSQLLEFIDIYPSLCELAGIEAPEHLQGRSFVALMRDAHADWKTSAISRFRSGDSIRTDRYRYSRYTKPNGQPVGQMLYDHQADPPENDNIAGKPAQSGVVERSAELLQNRMGRDE